MEQLLGEWRRKEQLLGEWRCYVKGKDARRMEQLLGEWRQVGAVAR